MKKLFSVLLVALLMMGMAIPALAENANPSVEKPLSPEPIYMSELFGGKGSIIIYDDWDKEEIDWDKIYEVPPAELAIRAANNMSTEGLTGYRKLISAGKISEVCANYEETLEQMYPGVDPEEMVITDVFEFDLIEGSLEALVDDPMNFIIVSFKYNVKESDAFMALQYVDGEWTAIEPESTRVKDGVVAFRLKNVGALAFLVRQSDIREGGSAVFVDDGRALPQTGLVMWPVVALAVLGLGLLTVGLVKRRRHE